MTYTLTATENKPQRGLVVGKGDGNSLKNLVCSTVELTAGATGRTVFFGYVDSGARISGTSSVYNDDCATTGAPVFLLGLDGDGITADPDALSASGITLATANSKGYAAVSDPADVGKYMWQLISGLTEDPKKKLAVYGTQTAAATTQTGTVAVEINGFLD